MFISNNQGMTWSRRTTFEAYFVVVVITFRLAMSIRGRGSIKWLIGCFDDAACLTDLGSWTVWSSSANFDGFSYLTLGLARG